MTRRELACVLIRLTGLSLLVQSLRMLPWSVALNENVGGMRTLDIRQFVDFAVAVLLALGLWVNSAGLSKLVAND